jgi:NAD(P)-dependent dehydrogenase (short-subunit alcohol dehydrogenase family)
MLLKSKVAVVTGAGSGMGRAGSLTFAAAGAHVHVVDLSAEAARETVAEIEAAGGRATATALDVRDLDALRAFAEQVGSAGPVHVLYNNVGIPGAAGLGLDAETWDHDIHINGRAGFLLSGYLEKALEAADGASVIFASSTSGLVGSPTGPLYSFAKGGVVALVRSLALAWAPRGIRVNAIAPGQVETPGLPGFFRTDDMEEVERRKQAFFAQIPLGRAARPEEIAQVALFLASDMSSYITGVTVPVDGGLTAR